MKRRNNNELPLVAISMLSMALTILGLSIIVFVKNQREREPIVYNQTRIVQPDHRYPKIPLYLTTGCYRLRTATKVLLGAVQQTKESSGSSWGIDLSEYGLPDKRYLMTAAHCILHDEDGIGPRNSRPVDMIEIQIRMERQDEKGRLYSYKKWVKCKVLIIDTDVDQALLETEEEVPVVFPLGKTAEVGSTVIGVGCPIGTTPAAKMGTLVSLDPEIDSQVKCQIWQADISFFFGNSGGPLLDAETEKVIGSLVAGLGKNQQLIPNLAIVIPCVEIRKMLDYNLRLPEMSESVTADIPTPKLPLPPKDPLPNPVIVPEGKK